MAEFGNRVAIATGTTGVSASSVLRLLRAGALVTRLGHGEASIDGLNHLATPDSFPERAMKVNVAEPREVDPADSEARRAAYAPPRWWRRCQSGERAGLQLPGRGNGLCRL